MYIYMPLPPLIYTLTRILVFTVRAFRSLRPPFPLRQDCNWKVIGINQNLVQKNEARWCTSPVEHNWPPPHRPAPTRMADSPED